MSVPVLHPIDQPQNEWTDRKVQEYMVFCLIDSNEPYVRVCKTYDSLLRGAWGYADMAEYLRSIGYREVHKRLKKAGYHYHNQMTRYLMRWAKSKYSGAEWLRKASREDLADNIKGIGLKLASMYVRGIRGEQVAVIDRFIRRWLVGEKKFYGPTKGRKGYYAMEKRFLELARDMHMSPYELDMFIWERDRVKWN